MQSFQAILDYYISMISPLDSCNCMHTVELKMQTSPHQPEGNYHTLLCAMYPSRQLRCVTWPGMTHIHLLSVLAPRLNKLHFQSVYSMMAEDPKHDGMDLILQNFFKGLANLPNLK